MRRRNTTAVHKNGQVVQGSTQGLLGNKIGNVCGKKLKRSRLREFGLNSEGGGEPFKIFKKRIVARVVLFKKKSLWQ